MGYLVAFFAIGLGWFILTFNGLVARRSQATNAFASIDVNLKKRHDLIPNIVNALKGYVSHEQTTLTRLTELRTQAMQANNSSSQRFQAEEGITVVLGEIQMVAEEYPTLKASENFLHLQRLLAEVEEQVSASRRAYNAAVMELNNAREMFPSMLVAGMMRFPARPFFAADEDERKNVTVRIS